MEQYIPRELLTKLETARTTSGPQGERRVVTMLFCDVTGSTSAAEQLDPEDWAQIMNGAFEHLIAPVYRYEGTLARLMGDAILAFFGAPIAHEDDPQRAVRAGLEIIQSIAPYREEVRREWGLDFQVRVGINTGLVVVGEVGSDLRVEYTALGDAINTAARMESLAEPGTVRVAADTQRLIEPLFEFEDLGLTDVRGKAEPVRSYKALGAKAIPGRLRGIEGHSAPLIGRDSELSVLREALERLGQGSGGIVCLIGEAGMGKSRLIDESHGEWKQIAGNDASWFESHGVSYDTTRPYGLFLQRVLQIFGIGDNDSMELVREKVATIPPDLPPDVHVRVVGAIEALLAVGSDPARPQLQGAALQKEVYGAFHSMLRAAASSAPTVAVLDDLHWADPASVDLLIDVLPLVDEVPLLLVCGFRPERQSPAWRVKQTAETDYPHRYREIALRALSDEDSDALFESLLNIADSPPQLRRMILEKTGGNPFFVEEFTRTLIDIGAVAQDESGMRWNADTAVADIPIPENLLALLTARIDRLEEDARRTLQLSSVIGRSFYHRVLKQISDTAITLDRELGTLQRAELILEAGRMPELEYVFPHDLTREAAYNSILLRARRKFHKQVGDAVEELFADRLEEQAHRLAHHFYEAQDYQRALDYSMMAGDSASRLYAHQEADFHYSRAIELVTGGSGTRQQRIYAYICRGRALELMGEFDQALANYHQLQSYAQEQNDPGLELAALMPQATVYSTATVKFDVDKGRELSNQGLHLAQELNDYAAESKVLWNLMLLEYFEGQDREQAISFGEQSLDIARRHGLQEQLAYTLNDIARAYFTVGKVEQAWAAQKESMDLLREMGNLTMLTDSLITSAGGHYFLGDFDDAMVSLEECVDVTKSTGSAWGQAVGLYVLGAVYIESGEIGKCVQALEDALPLAKQAGFSPPVKARLRLALYHGMLGNIDQGFQLANEALEEGDNRQFTHAALAQLHLCQGNISEADTAIKEACRELENRKADPKAGYAIFQVIESDIAVANQQYDEAIATTDRTLSVLQEMGPKVFLPDILRCKGEALFGLGRSDEARTILQEALALAEEQNSRRALWAILSALARLASHYGDEAEANDLRTRALDVIQYMADRAGSEESKTAFLDSPKVKQLMGTA